MGRDAGTRGSTEPGAEAPPGDDRGQDLGLSQHFGPLLADAAAQGFSPKVVLQRICDLLGASHALFLFTEARLDGRGLLDFHALGFERPEALRTVCAEAVRAGQPAPAAAADAPLLLPPLRQLRNLGTEAADGSDSDLALPLEWLRSDACPVFLVLPKLVEWGLAEHSPLHLAFTAQKQRVACVLLFFPTVPDAPTVELCRAVAPWLRVHVLAHAAGLEGARCSAALDALIEELSWPVWLVDGEGRPWRTNAAGMAALGSDSELGRELERAVRGRSRRLRVVPLADNEGSRAYLVSLPDGPTQPAPRAQRAQARYGLTRRESEVLTELLRGASNKEIARRIGCATRTVEDHVARILRKLGASSRSAAIAKLWMERL